jgi:putative ABC transport system permease protein
MRRRTALREHGPSILVAILSSTFGVMLLLATRALGVLIDGDAATGNSHIVSYILNFIAFVFVAIAIYVGAVVTSNTFATIVAGRTRTIALLRLIGSSAADQRRAVAREGLTVGLVGSVIGLVLGIGANAALIWIALATHFIPPLAFQYFDASVILPVVAVVLTTWLASWIGSRRVLVVTPIQSTGAAQEHTLEEATHRSARNAVAIVLFVLGTGILLGGVALGQTDPKGVLVGVLGGLLSFSGVVVGAELVMPPTLRLIGRLLGRSASSRLAAQNALRYPERSARTTIGLVIGVTLITMFAVATQTVLVIIDAARKADPEVYQNVDQILTITAVIFSVVGGFSAVIAAVGMVNNLSLSVLQRTRELGLLRALGFTARQVRAMIVAESIQLTVAAVVVGLVLGTFYGWAGAESMLGAIQGSPGLVLPAVPAVLVIGVVIAAAVLTWLASATPARRATRVAPVTALAVE